MLKLISLLIKLTIFSVLVLAIGNLVQWRGRTISDQVRSSMAQVEREVEHRMDPGTAHAVRQWSKKLNLGSEATSPKFKVEKIKAAPGAQEEGPDRIPLSERQKLRDLIRELNGSR